MGSFTLDGRQPGQLTKMFLILLASTLLQLCRGHSLGTDLYTSQHGAEDNQKVEYDLITKAVTFETRAKRSIPDVHFTCPDRRTCTPQNIGRGVIWYAVDTPKDIDMSGEGMTGPVSRAVKNSLRVYCANVETSSITRHF